MAAITTPRIVSLVNDITKHFQAYTFEREDIFCWRPGTLTIAYPGIRTVADVWTLLHEIAHAELKHREFTLDIELIDQEVAAWEHARHKIAPLFKQNIPDEHIQEHLDTYRLWLHERSRCPDCTQNGFQTTQNTYRCSNCRCLWRVNDARGCALRRTKLKVI